MVSLLTIQKGNKMTVNIKKINKLSKKELKLYIKDELYYFNEFVEVFHALSEQNSWTWRGNYISINDIFFHIEDDIFKILISLREKKKNRIQAIESGRLLVKLQHDSKKWVNIGVYTSL